jgi:undecaprenyl pyrophosphate phosphatase UppP
MSKCIFLAVEIMGIVQIFCWFGLLIKHIARWELFKPYNVSGALIVSKVLLASTTKSNIIIDRARNKLKNVILTVLTIYSEL